MFSSDVSPRQCVMAAQPYIAQWVGEHPKWTAVKWRCEYPHRNDRAEGELRPRADHRARQDYLLQSFKSLSAIENTASALISILRTTHCLASR